MTKREIKAALKALDEQAKPLRAALEEIEAKVKVKCQKCGRSTQARKLVLVTHYWYESPYGCTGGDRWHPGDLHWECPKCGHDNRVYDKDGKAALERIRYRFKDRKKHYPKGRY